MLRMRAQNSVASRTTGIVFALVLAAALGACFSNGGSQGLTAGPVPSPVPPALAPPAALTANPPRNAVSAELTASRGHQTGAGLWHGKVLRGGPVVDDTTCLVTKTGELTCILRDPSFCCYTQPLRTRDNRPGALHGVVQFDGADRASGSGILYAAPGKVLADGKSVVADFTITGGALKDQSRSSS